MKTKILLLALSLLLLINGTLAFSPAPCVTTTGCDCESEFCTHPQLSDYTTGEKFKDLFGLLGSTFGKSTTFDVYLYGSFPTAYNGKHIRSSEASVLGFGYKNKRITEFKGLENVDGFHQYKVKVDPFWGWNKIKLPLDRKSTRLNSSHIPLSRMPSSA